MRTDLSIVQLPTTLPNFGSSLGKNIIQFDPDFGQPIVRLSDASDYNGKTIKTADSATCGLWNKNDTMFMAKATGGWPVLYQFDPVAMQGKLLNFSMLGQYCFSRLYGSTLFVLSGTQVSKVIFTKDSTGTWVAGTPIFVCDFAKILPSGFVVTWSSVFLISNDDTTFGVAFSNGIQNTGIYCCEFQTGHAGAGYRMLNTQTGQVTGMWGTTGAATLVSPAMKFPFTIHEFWQTPNNGYSTIVPPGQSSQAFWNIPTTSIQDPNSSGHAAYGYLHMYTGGPGGGQIAEFAYSNLAKRLVIPASGLPANQSPAQKYQGDQHFAFGKVDLLDQSIIWVSSQSQVYPFTSAWMNEIRGVRVSDGAVLRACHTFNSGLSTEFDVQNAIAVPSQTGNFVAFSSDIMQTLGGRQGDVFIVKTT